MLQKNIQPKKFQCSESKAFLEKAFGKLLEKESILKLPCCKILDL